MTRTPGRVALVTYHSSPAQQAGTGDSGGMNVLVLEVARTLAARGSDVDLITRAVREPHDRQLEPGVTLREVPAGGPGELSRDGLADAADEFGEGVAALAGRRGARYDLIHSHYWLSGLATLPVAIELDIPFVQSFHTLAAMKRREAASDESERRAYAETFVATQASAVVAGSAAEATSLIDEVGASAERVWVVPPGVDVDRFRPNRSAAEGRVRSLLGIAPGRPILVTVGRIQPLKDQELAIRTLASVHSMHGWAPVLVVVGDATPGDEDYVSLLRVVADELGVADDVRFLGSLNHEALADLLAASTVTLASSHSETFGLVTLESAASGTPVIGHRASGLAESIAHGRSGLLLDSRDPDDWGGAVSKLLEDPPALGRLSATAREWALGHTWDATLEQLLDVYDTIL